MNIDVGRDLYFEKTFIILICQLNMFFYCWLNAERFRGVIGL